MGSSRRDLSWALGAAFILACAGVLVTALRLPGFVLALLLLLGFATLRTRMGADPEVAALRASLGIARDDIADVLAEFDELLHGLTPEAVADRTLHFPALADPSTTNPVIQDFHLRAAAAQRFVARIDAHCASHDLDRGKLEKLIAIADERALALAASWKDARRAARELGSA
ncbi:hypothetical protein CAPI_04760 [Corynebacterium capitovis DSM 44611]|uniref:hypothetical protein n=1 Tax=Corynebacterium capitovis TaxID=131081 RepID=UPI0003675809|nr:hypothetical protein [Corynebacterium capitovis]WKD57510.1 hypothetical protein CAPI_04760 [Corynebacterium capitovis DSM 44611]